jgi:hypothetical protein
MTLHELTSLLEASGPYGVVAILAWAFWRIMQRKDLELREMTDIIVGLAKSQTEAINKTEGALTALTSALRDRPLK